MSPLSGRPPEPHSLSHGQSQPSNVTNASLLERYRFHSSRSLRRSQPKINKLPTISRLFPAQECLNGLVRDQGHDIVETVEDGQAIHASVAVTDTRSARTGVGRPARGTARASPGARRSLLKQPARRGRVRTWQLSARRRER